MIYTKSISDRIFNTASYVVMVLLCIFTLYPFIYVFMYSISDGIAASAQPITFYPLKPTLMNYQAVFANNRIMNSFFISVARTVTGSVLHLMITAMAAYAISKKDLLWRNRIMPFYIIPMYFSGGLLPYYVLITKLQLQNNFLVYILPGAFGVFHMLLIKVFFENIPASMEESARIDGAGEFAIFIKIVMPTSLPVIATVMLFVGVAQWNTWLDTFLFVTNMDLYPLQALLRKIILESQTKDMMDIMKRLSQTSQQKVTPEAIKMATLMVATVPIIVVYPFLQKYFVKGMMIGSVKG